MRGIWLLLATLGCGRIGFDPTGNLQPDACTQFGSWSVPQPLSQIESPMQDWGGSISPDGLGLYFDSDRTGVNAIYEARRPDRASAFTAATAIAGLDASGALANPTVTRDELEIFFDQGTTGSWCPYTATRATITSAWGAAVPAFACAQDVRGASVSPDGLTLYYYFPDSSQVAVSTRTSRDIAFEMSTTIVASGDWPGISGDGLTLYTDEGTHVLAASRADVGSMFGPAAEVPGLAAATGQDGDASITEDGLEIDFASDRDGGVGGYDLYAATRTCP